MLAFQRSEIAPTVQVQRHFTAMAPEIEKAVMLPNALGRLKDEGEVRAMVRNWLGWNVVSSRERVGVYFANKSGQYQVRIEKGYMKRGNLLLIFLGLPTIAKSLNTSSQAEDQMVQVILLCSAKVWADWPKKMGEHTVLLP